jgi:hypothetical protein
MTIQELSTFQTTRQFGIELEADPVGNPNVVLPTAAGWDMRGDGSLSINGKEYVMNGPANWEKTVEHVNLLCTALRNTRVNLGRTGSLHVHVSASDYTPAEGTRLLNLYRHFNPAILKLIGTSRAANRYCYVPPMDMTVSEVIERFRLDDIATRAVAHGRRAGSNGEYHAVNLTYLGVPTAERSVEFRQNSPSTRAVCILGWAAFCASLMELESEDISAYPATLGGLCRFLNEYDQGLVVRWIKWREKFLSTIEQKDLDKVIMAARFKAIGIFGAARVGDCSIAAVRTALDKAVEQGIRSKIGLKYRSNYATWAKQDLELLKQSETISA